ncbi:MAG: LysE family transporter [Alphaproteobacteria bacterium]|jgi:putative LysE/RhtB family amino acid efflux pump|nr:LysE family transporter [Alphaproteobacteria bacterium]MBP9877871.1 LysE family transporter [Alphaproteobacteria bacterium]
MSIHLYFFEAWIIGIAIAAPVGPIGMLCIRKTLEIGLKGALLVGLGAAIADAMYGMIAALGLTAISNIMLNMAGPLKLIGGLFLLYLAYKEITSAKTPHEAHIKEKSSLRMVIEVFFLTITNPATILSFLAIFASIGRGATSTLESLTLVLGIFLGSMTWWLILGFLISKIRHRLPKAWLERIKWLSCFIIGGFGLWAIISAVMV